jgi:lysophospholipase L1-like esterase
MAPTVRNWVFLGDSLTEGVGSKRISHVAELAKQLRAEDCMAAVNVHDFRLRRVNENFNQFVDFNVAGFMNIGTRPEDSDLWLWNLACEGQTIEADFEWLPFIRALRPEVVLIFRGSLESIIRPAMVRDGDWPWWVPGSWRGYAAMDPRCYFSATWWRKAKQSSLDSVKQSVRLKLLKQRSGRPLLDLENLATRFDELIEELRALEARVVVLGLLPLSESRFPGSPEHFKTVNRRLSEIAAAQGVEFLDWGCLLPASVAHEDLFYRDSFHPNAAGAGALATILRDYLQPLNK